GGGGGGGGEEGGGVGGVGGQELDGGGPLAARAFERRAFVADVADECGQSTPEPGSCCVFCHVDVRPPCRHRDPADRSQASAPAQRRSGGAQPPLALDDFRCQAQVGLAAHALEIVEQHRLA